MLQAAGTTPPSYLATCLEHQPTSHYHQQCHVTLPKHQPAPQCCAPTPFACHQCPLPQHVFDSAMTLFLAHPISAVPQQHVKHYYIQCLRLVRPSILHSMKPFSINTWIQVPGIWWPVTSHIRLAFALGPYYNHAQEQQDKGCFMQCSHCHCLWNRALFLLLGAYQCLKA